MKSPHCVFLVFLLSSVVACAGSEVRPSDALSPPVADKAEAPPPVLDPTPVTKPEADLAAAAPGVGGAAASVGKDEGEPADGERGPEAGAAQTASAAQDPTAVAAAAADSEAAGLPSPDVEALYQQCLARVEGREADGECVDNDDCVAAGCSTEICTTKVAAEGMMSTCENKPCFAVLDSCGCNAGRCQWSLKGAVPPLGPSLQLDPK